MFMRLRHANGAQALYNTDAIQRITPAHGHPGTILVFDVGPHDWVHVITPFAEVFDALQQAHLICPLVVEEAPAHVT